MKPMYTEAIFAIFMGLVVPAIVLGTAVAIREKPAENTPPQTVQTETSGTVAPLSVRFRQEDGEIREMDMDEYLVGVVCGEMPAYFEEEALKAQAVVARTYALKALKTGGKHHDGSVCGDSACCQAYIPWEDYLAKNPQENLERIRSAVTATSGAVLVYQGELIEATYFSCSGGKTEDAAAVWGADFPYLRATDSPGEEKATYYTDSVYIPKETLCSALEISLGEDPAAWVGMTTYTAGGGVNTMILGGKEFGGTQLRKALGLRSTAFTVSWDAGGITFETRGYGHRVGMSQYGADAMAASGSSFDQILAHYYAGTELIQWEN